MGTRLKRMVIKEELVDLTGDFKLAIVLNQMMYWSERVHDFDLFLQEENEKLNFENLELVNMEYKNGWIYKKAIELAEECMITNSESTMRRYLDKLVTSGWLDSRKNPKFKWDNTLQYRVNLKKIQYELKMKGYSIEGYRLPLVFQLGEEMQSENRKVQHDTSHHLNENELKMTQSIPHHEKTKHISNTSNVQSESYYFQNEGNHFQNERTIPKNTSKITSEKELKKEEKSMPLNLYSFFEQNGFGTIGSYLSEKISKWSEQLSDELVLEAMKLALEQGAKKWSYVEKILINWADHKIQTIGQARAFVLAYKEKRNKKGASKINQSKRVEMLPDWFEESPQQLAIIPQKDLDERMRLLKERISKLS